MSRLAWWRGRRVWVVRRFKHQVRVKDLATGEVFTVHPDDLGQSVDSSTR